MNQTLKNILWVVGALVVIVVAVAAVNGISAYSRSAVSAATFQVTGSGKAFGTPDVAEFTFSVMNQGGMDIGTTQQANTDSVNAAIAFVKSDGVAAADIQTQGYDIEPRYQNSCLYAPQSVGGGVSSNALAPAIIGQCSSNPTIIGYTVSQTVQVKIRDFSKIGDILSGVTTKGANSVSGLTFTVDNPETLTTQARTQAFQDAQTQAKAMAAAGGFTLGRLVGVNDQSNTPFPRAYALGSAANVSAAPATPDIEAGSQEVDDSVTLTYEIQ